MSENERQPGDLRINDQHFFIPPTEIQVNEQAINFSADALRQKESAAIKSGHSILQFTITLVFGQVLWHPDGRYSASNSFDQLARLLHQVQYCPFISMENEMLRMHTGLDPSQQMGGVLQSVTVYSGAGMGMPEALVAVLQIQYFNYLPYVSNLFYTGNFDKKQLETWATMYRRDVVSFQDNQKPYSIGALYNRTALDPKLSPSSNQKLNLDGEFPIYGEYGTIFEEYMYSGKRSISLTKRLVQILTNDIILEFFEWAKPKEDAPTDPGLRNNPAQKTIDDNSDFVTHPGLAFVAGVNNRFHKQKIGALMAAAEKWYTAHNRKPIPIVDMARTVREQMALKNNPRTANVASDPRVGRGSHINNCAFDIRMASKRVWTATGKVVTYKESKTLSSTDPRLSFIPGVDGGLTESEWNEWVGYCAQSGLYPLSRLYGAEESWHFEPAGWRTLPGVNTKGLTSEELDTALANNQVNAIMEDGWVVDVQRLTQMIEEANKYGLTEVQSLLGSLVDKDLTFPGGSDGPGTIKITGEKATKIQQAFAKSYDAYIKRELENKGEGFETVNTELGIFFRKKHTFTIAHDSQTLVPQNVAVTVAHNLVSIPIIGWNYPTHQFLGPQKVSGSIVLKAVGEQGISDLQTLLRVFHMQQENATTYRILNSRNPVTIKNSILQLAGLDKVILETAHSKTIDGEPEARQASISFTSTNPEADQAPLEMAYYRNDIHIQRMIFKWLMGQVPIVVNTTGIKQVEDFGATTSQTPMSDNLTTLSVGGMTPVTTISIGKATSRDSIINSLGDRLIEIVKRHMTAEGVKGDKWDILTNIPVEDRTGLSEINNIKNLRDLCNTGRNIVSNDGEGSSIINDTLGTTFDDEIVAFYRAGVFPALMEFSNPELDAILRNYNTLGQLIGRPGYPDLDLPVNPITGYELDTYPDFFFYNPADCQVMNDKTNWDNWLNHAQDWLDTSYAHYQRQIFNAGMSDGGIMSASFFFSNQAKNKQQPKAGDGMTINLPNPGLPERIKEGATDIITIDDPTDYKATGERILQDTKVSLNHGTTQVGNFNVNMEGKEAEARLAARFKDLASRDVSADILLDNNQNAKKMPMAKDKYTHQFSAQKYKELMVSGFRKDFYYDKQAMRRAYPTFKLYLIDEDTDQASVGTRYTDDFYSNNAISGLTVTRHRDLPASTAIIEIVDLDNSFLRKQYEHGETKVNRGSAVNPDVSLEGTPQGVNLDNVRQLAVKDGTKIQIRLGYSNNPSELENVFNGQIVSVEGSGILTMICQDYGTELVAQPLSYNDANWWFNADTYEILSSFICRPECKHFGRFEVLPQVSGPYLKLRPDGKFDRIWSLTKETADDNIFVCPVDNYYNFGWGLLGSAWEQKWDVLMGVPMFLLGSGGIFTGPIGMAISVAGAWKISSPIRKNFLNFQPSTGQTVWEVFKEMELRHPGWSAMTLPYEDRMTIFFGDPALDYFYRDNTSANELKFERLVDNWRKIMPDLMTLPAIQIGTNTLNAVLKYTVQGSIDQIKNFNSAGGMVGQVAGTAVGFIPGASGVPGVSVGTAGKLAPLAGFGEMAGDWATNNDRLRDFGDRLKRLQQEADKIIENGLGRKSLGEVSVANRVKPLRQYHMVTSENDIVVNNIRADSKNVHNAVRVFYNTGNAEDNRNNQGLDLSKTGYASLLVKLDDDFEPEMIKEKMVIEPNAQGTELAQRYAVGHLLRECRRYYRGELVILGNPKIKPGDVVYIFDSYNDMVGPIEVERVTHIFRKETGFITEIIPQMCCTVNEEATLHIMDASSKVLHELWSTYGVPNISLKVAGGSTAVGLIGLAGGPVMALGTIGISATLAIAGGMSLVRMIMSRHPIIMTPLLRNGKPYTSGMSTYEIDGLISHIGGQWNKWINDVSAGAKYVGRGWRYVSTTWWMWRSGINPSLNDWSGNATPRMP